MLGTCKQIRIEGGCDPHAVLQALEDAGIDVENVASVTDFSIVAVRNHDWSEEVESKVRAVFAATPTEPHPVRGAVATNHALFARRMPPPPEEHLLAAKRFQGVNTRSRKAPR